jgi:hypothetical protein
VTGYASFHMLTRSRGTLSAPDDKPLAGSNPVRCERKEQSEYVTIVGRCRSASRALPWPKPMREGTFGGFQVDKAARALSRMHRANFPPPCCVTR